MDYVAEEYLRNARHCEQLADETPDDRMAVEYLNIADGWRELADRVERYNFEW
jgi:hypothetical protein